jgi:hypothetical protein
MLNAVEGGYAMVSPVREAEAEIVPLVGYICCFRTSESII